MIEPRSLLRSLFEAAVRAADPEESLRPFMPPAPKGRTVVVGAGKGAAQLARAFEKLWHGPLAGTVVTRYGYRVPCERIEVLEAAHPVPDAAGLAASERLFEAVRDLGPDDLVVALICGGGSSLLPAPQDGLTLEDEIALNKALLASGAPISAMNAIRNQVSRIKGGRLAAAAAPARVVSLVVSDIPGDDPALVASGPTVPSASGRAEALAAVARYRIALPERVARHIASVSSEAPRPDDPVFAGHEVHVIASASISLEAAARTSRAQGIPAVILSDSVEGEARESAHLHAAIAREVRQRGRPFTAPVVILSGGETTVTLRGAGKGGRNSEFALSMAIDLKGSDGIHVLAADTDGIDGSEDNAGAFADGGSVARLAEKGLDAAVLLADNDAWSAFAAIGDLFITGPTGTNVNDFRAILVWD